MINCLDRQVIIYICKHLSGKDQYHLSLTCKYLNEIVYQYSIYLIKSNILLSTYTDKLPRSILKYKKDLTHVYYAIIQKDFEYVDYRLCYHRLNIDDIKNTMETYISTNTLSCFSDKYLIMDIAMKRGDLDVLQMLEDVDYLPNQPAINTAAKYGHFDIIKYFEKLILPNIDGINNACEKGYIHIIKYLANFYVYPNQHGLILASANGHLNVIEYAIDKKMTFCESVMDMAVKNGRMDILKFLISHQIFHLKTPLILLLKMTN